MNNIEIFEAFLRGDPKGIEPICLVCSEPLILYGLKYVPNRTAVEDIVADAFELLLQKIGTFEDDAHIQKWLHTVVWNKCQEVRREIKLFSAVPEIAENTPDPDAEESIHLKESSVHTQWIIRKIYDKLQELPKKRSQDFYAHFFKSKSFEEIAIERNVSEYTVRQNVRYALKKIRKHLKIS